jgi:hypothetical protein
MGTGERLGDEAGSCSPFRSLYGDHLFDTSCRSSILRTWVNAPNHGARNVQRPAGLAGSNRASVGVLAPIATSATSPIAVVFGLIR